MIPKQLYDLIWRQGYEQAQVNTPLIGTAGEPTDGEQRRDWRNFTEQYPSGTWSTEVFEFIGDPNTPPTVIGVTTPDGMPHAKAVEDWKPAGIRARRCGPLEKTLAEPARISLFVDTHEPRETQLRAELDTYGTTPNQLHTALVEAPGVQTAKVYEEYTEDFEWSEDPADVAPGNDTDDGRAAVEEGVDVTEKADEVSVTLEVDGESIEVTDFDYTADIEQTDDCQLRATIDPEEMEFTGSFTVTWGDDDE